MKESVFYFAYGSNMHLYRLRQRVQSAEFQGVVCLDGYRFAVNKRSADGSSKCNLMEDLGQHAWGVVFSLNKSDVSSLDRAEGLGYGYQKSWHHVELGGQQVEIFLYVADSAYISTDVLPYDWYMNFVLYGAKAYGLPEDYCSMIQQIPTMADPNENRVWLNQQILESVPPPVPSDNFPS